MRRYIKSDMQAMFANVVQYLKKLSHMKNELGHYYYLNRHVNTSSSPDIGMLVHKTAGLVSKDPVNWPSVEIFTDKQTNFKRKQLV